MTKLKVELVDVYCGNTEDVTGADDFYLVGGLVGGGITKGILTTPVKINDKQRKSFKPNEAVLFEGEIPQGEIVRGGLKAYDEDFGKDWTGKYGDTVQEISSAISGVLGSIPPTAIAGTVLSVATKGISFFSQLDKDDLLGTTELEISSAGPSREERTWVLSKTSGLGWSTWDYKLTYRISRS